MAKDPIMEVMELLYPYFRPLLLKAVDDPDSDWDDTLMRIIDDVFDKMTDPSQKDQVMVVAEYLYAEFLRGLLINYIDDPEATWDDRFIAILDDILDYQVL